MMFLLVSTSYGQNDLIITGVIDGPRSGGVPKAIELYVINTIADLSVYSLGVAANGGGSDGPEFALSGSATAGDYIYIASETTGFTAFFGFAPNFTSGQAGINGDDPFEIFYDATGAFSGSETLVDEYGDVALDGTGEAWEYTDGWAYRNSNTTANAGSFNTSNWTFSGTNALDALGSTGTNNDDGATAFPLGTYSTTSIPNVTITGDAGWRMLSLPITGGDVEDISDDTEIQGITGGSNASDDANFYINPASDGTSGNGYVEPTNTTTAWGDGEGFIVYFFDNTTAGSAELPITLDATGSEPSGNVTVTLSNTFTLLGNPYASNFNIDGVAANGFGLNSTVSIFSDADGNFRTINIGSGDIIGPWQGFFVERADGTATLATISETSKTTSVSNSRVFEKKNNEIGLIKLSMIAPEGFADNGTQLYFSDDASLEPNDRYDGGKLTGLSSAPTIAFANDGELFAQDARPISLTSEQTYRLELADAGIEGEYTLRWPVMKNIPENWSITLRDLEKGVTTDLRVEDSYTFEVQAKQKRVYLTSLLLPKAKQVASSGSPRFEIILAPGTTSVSNEPGDTPLSFGLEQNYPNPFNPSTTINYTIAKSGQVSLSVYNLMGQKVAELVNEVKGEGSYNVSWNAAGAASGMYYYRLEAAGQTLTRKMTLIK